MTTDKLIDALADSDEHALRLTRQELYQQGKQSAEQLIAALGHSNRNIVIEATRVLGMFQKQALAALPGLINNCDSINVELRRVSIAAMGRIAQRPSLSLPVLARALADPDLQVRQFAAASIGMFGLAAVSVIDELIVAIHDQDEVVRHFALSILDELQPTPGGVSQYRAHLLRSVNTSRTPAFTNSKRLKQFNWQANKKAVSATID